MIIQPSQRGLRLLLVMPLAALIVAALVLIVVSPSASGAGREFRYPDKLPVLGGIIFATPSLLFGLVAFMKVWRRTSVAVLVAPRRTLLGLISISMAVALLAAYSLLVGEPDSYRGEFNPVQWRWEPMFPQSTFVQVSVFIAIGYPMGILGPECGSCTARVLRPTGSLNLKPPTQWARLRALVAPSRRGS